MVECETLAVKLRSRVRREARREQDRACGVKRREVKIDECAA